jgi:RNA polymerase-binding transcription factor
MSALDIESIRRRLLDERQRVIDAIEYLHHEHPGSLEDESEERTIDNHLAETATVTLDRELDYTLEENANRALHAIDSALERIDAGTYGTCRRCGREINPERLDAIPWATLCIEDKRKDERG